jgi:hypothetical protein
MPLINFKTNLTSLRFGMDQPGGGDSGQPFIQSPIETVNTPTETKRFYELNRTSLDYPVRGGAISSLVNGAYTTDAAAIDTERIKKFFKSAPQGEAFIRKQKGLQLSNPKTQVPNSLQFVGLSLDNAVIPVTQVYNPANTIAQVGVQGTGTHFNRHGNSPNVYESVRQTYQYIAGAPQNNTTATNRLSILRALKLISSRNFTVSSDTTYAIGIDPLLVDRLGISSIQNQLFNYPGGPGSTYGDGFTRIFRYTDTDATKVEYTNGFTVGGVSKPYSAIALTYQQLAGQNTRTTNPASPVQATIQDFRSKTNNGTPVIPYSPSNYTTSNMVTRLNIGNPGAPKASVRYNNLNAGNKTPNETGVDKLNALGPFFFNTNTEDPWNQKDKISNKALPTSDIIKFAFECLDNDNPGGPATVALIFRAFLDGAISDTNQASYNSYKYIGRGETFRTYQGFDRSISFSFKMFAQSRQEMLPMYQKLNQLVSQVYPDYSDGYNLMRGSVVKLTIGDYLYRTPGFLENVNITIDNSNTPWEIVLNEFTDIDTTTKQTTYVDSKMAQLPHMVAVQCNFRPIMDILPRRQTYSHPNVALLANNGDYLKGNPVTTTVNGVQTAQTTTTAANTANNTGASPCDFPDIRADIEEIKRNQQEIIKLSKDIKQ